jgi:hypothetical protein
MLTVQKDTKKLLHNKDDHVLCASPASAGAQREADSIG